MTDNPTQPETTPPSETAPPLTCPHCLEPLVESEGVEGPGGNLWHSECLDSWREDV